MSSLRKTPKTFIDDPSLGSSKLVILAGLAELISGAISMGLGAYLAACTEDEHYKSEEKRQRRAVCVEPKQEAEALYEMMATYGVTRDATTPLVESLCCNTDMWVQFAMDLVLKLDKQSRLRAYVSGATMGFAYFAGKYLLSSLCSILYSHSLGGIIPMIPYFAIARVTNAFFVSIGLTALVLLAFGYIKTRVVIASHRTAFFGALQTLTIGGIAAGASYGIVRALGGHNSCS